MNNSFAYAIPGLSPQRCAPRPIIRKVTEYFGMPEQYIHSKSRTANVVRVRHITMYLLRSHTTLSYKDIGKKIGGRDHSSVIHGIKMIENDMRLDQGKINQHLFNIKERLKGTGVFNVVGKIIKVTP